MIEMSGKEMTVRDSELSEPIFQVQYKLFQKAMNEVENGENQIRKRNDTKK